MGNPKHAIIVTNNIRIQTALQTCRVIAQESRTCPVPACPGIGPVQEDKSFLRKLSSSYFQKAFSLKAISVSISEQVLSIVLSENHMLFILFNKIYKSLGNFPWLGSQTHNFAKRRQTSASFDLDKLQSRVKPMQNLQCCIKS